MRETVMPSDSISGGKPGKHLGIHRVHRIPPLRFSFVEEGMFSNLVQ
jgi:hypothetical protein